MSARRSAECLFASDLHGDLNRYEHLFSWVRATPPAALFLGGDLLPHPLARQYRNGVAVGDFVGDVLLAGFEALRARLGDRYPTVFLVLGNDDPRAEEPAMRRGERRRLWRYVHGRRFRWRSLVVYGYSCVPPTPFLLKDWERYDVSRQVDPGCVSPEEGWRTVRVDAREASLATIRDDLDALAADDQARAIWLFHAPPYATSLDRAALDGRFVDGVPVDPHVGSIAIRRFIEARQPLLTLHGHVHEAVRLTGTWRARLGRTHAFQGAHDGPELAVVRFDPNRLDEAERVLVS